MHRQIPLIKVYEGKFSTCSTPAGKATHVLDDSDRDPNRNIGANGTLDDRLSSLETPSLVCRGGRPIERGREGPNAEEGEEQGEELEEAEHGGTSVVGVLIIGLDRL